MIRNLIRLCLTVVGWRRAQQEAAGTRFFPAEDTLVLDKMKEVWIEDTKVYMHAESNSHMDLFFVVVLGTLCDLRLLLCFPCINAGGRCLWPYMVHAR